MKTIIYSKLFFIFFLIAAKSWAQTEDALVNDVVIPPSPEAASIGKFAEHPVGYYTGIPSISIPFYTIESGRIKVPVSLDYHASGVKLEETPSRVGLGWSLSAGGTISRSVRGGLLDEIPKFEWNYSDDAYEGYGTAFTVGYLNKTYPIDYFENKPNNIDKELDIYYYSFPGGSGKLFFPEADKPIISPYKNYIVTGPLEGERGNVSMNDTKGFEIVDDNGIIYEYKATERTLVTKSGICVNSMYIAGLENYISAWYLTKITDPVTQREVVFEYDDLGSFSHDTNVSMTYEPDSGADDCSSCSGQSTGSCSVTMILSNIKILRKITFDQGYVLFNASTGSREDLNGDKSIESIQLYSKDNQLIKTLDLDLDYAHIPGNNSPIDKRLYLKGVTETGTDASQTLKHSFDYYAINQLPARNSNQQDAWGYFNDNGAADGFAPPPKIYIYQNSGIKSLSPIRREDGTTSTDFWNGADRSANANTAHYGTLQRIHYPTGGNTTFHYEPHLFGNSMGGGLRISKKEIFTGSQLLTTEYHYEGGRGTIPSLASLCSINYMTRSSQNQAVLGKFQGAHVGYDQVEVINTSPSGLQNGKTVYRYDFLSDVNASYEVHSKTGNAACADQLENFIFKHTDFPNYNPTDKSHLRGNLLSEAHYKSTETGYEIVARTFYEYDQFKKYNIDNTTVKAGYTYSAYNGSKVNIMAEYEIDPHITLATKKREVVYDDDGKKTESVTEFTYGNNNLYLSEEKSEGMNGQWLSTTYAYPSSSDPVGSKMVDLNYISPIVAKSIKDGETVITSQSVKYQEYGPQLIYPSQLYVNSELRAEYKGYGQHGNLIEVVKDKENKVAYLWDNDELRPIAQMSNHDNTNDVGIESFEKDAQSTFWNYQGTRVPGGITGDTYLQLIPSAYVTSTKSFTQPTYIISYWAKDGNVSIAFESATDYTFSNISNGERDIDGWKYYEIEMKYTGGTPNVNIPLKITGNCKLDELRIYPKGALVTTYTYKSMVGISSICDPNNVISYYMYDSFGRLLAIKDAKGNVLKKYEYYYQNH